MCKECYINNSRITPLLNPVDCLSHSTQYMRNMRALYLYRTGFEKRAAEMEFSLSVSGTGKALSAGTADVAMKKSCGIYEIKSSRGRISYKIFPGEEELQSYLKKNRNKICEAMSPVLSRERIPGVPIYPSAKADA